MHRHIKIKKTVEKPTDVSKIIDELEKSLKHYSTAKSK